ncbi:Flagellar biosynthesis protein FliP [Candidatus Burkholderia pumila]|uniref:Flagellar biosynthetic protein FliP n=1 Tax=Candidatus Burkholderia pumila TaxID=1090375 RepID=A0ABR5HK37_9BURK|nr:Flagellar biosynthesis protein FliP [Candidatus Burkholderia pumila]
MYPQTESMKRFAVALLSAMPFLANAADMNAVNHAAQIASGDGAVLQTLFGLMISFMFGCAWLGTQARREWREARRHGEGECRRRRVAGWQGAGVAVIEVGDQWLMLGAGPGNVRLLHTMPAGSAEVESIPEQPNLQGNFGQRFHDAAGRRSEQAPGQVQAQLTRLQQRGTAGTQSMRSGRFAFPKPIERVSLKSDLCLLHHFASGQTTIQAIERNTVSWLSRSSFSRLNSSAKRWRASSPAGASNAGQPQTRARRELALPVVIGLMPMLALAQSTTSFPAFNTSSGPNGGTTYSLSVQIMLLLTMLSFLPAMVLMMMMSFTRIIIVLSLLRQALGTQSTPPNQVLVGLALFLSFFVMSPVLDKAYTDAYKPFSEGTITMDQAMTRGVAPFKPPAGTQTPPGMGS